MKHRVTLPTYHNLKYKDKHEYIHKYGRRVDLSLMPSGKAIIQVGTSKPYTTVDYLLMNCPDLDKRFPSMRKLLNLCYTPDLIPDEFLREYPMFNFSPMIIPPKLTKDEYYIIRSNNAPQLKPLEGSIVKVVSVQNVGHQDIYTLRIACVQKRRFQPSEIILYDTHGKHDLDDIFMPIKRKEN